MTYLIIFPFGLGHPVFQGCPTARIFGTYDLTSMVMLNAYLKDYLTTARRMDQE